MLLCMCTSEHINLELHYLMLVMGTFLGLALWFTVRFIVLADLYYTRASFNDRLLTTHVYRGPGDKTSACL